MKAIHYFINSLILVLLFNLLSIKSLSDDCPSGNGSWSQDSYTYNIWYYDASGSADYSYQNQSGSTSLKINWSTLNIVDAQTTSNSAWKKIIEQSLVKKLVVDNCPHFDGMPWIINVYYEKECSTTTKFVYNLDLTTQIACCTDPEISQKIYDQYKDGQFHKVYYIYKDIVCGVKCCRKQYSCTIRYSSFDSSWYATIDQVQTYSVTTCGGYSNNIDCITGNPTPCVDGSCD